MKHINMRLLLVIFAICMALPFVSCSSPEEPVPPPDFGGGPGSGGGPEPATTKIYYISPQGSDANNGLASDTPWKTFGKVLDNIKPGDVVNVMDGTYSTASGPLINMEPKHSGEADQYITIKAMDGHKPVITAYGNVWNAMMINASYIIVDGIEFMGYNQHLTYEDAYATYEHYLAGGRDWARIAGFSTNGITIGGPSKESKLPHHVTIRNCAVHDFPGGGLNAIQADYITFENNVVYNNAWYAMYACSGISILCPFNSDQSTEYKNIVTGNYSHTNKTLIPWHSLNPPKLSDGNGIIIDVNIRPYDGGVVEGNEAYTGRTLVTKNISVNNGGSGIHSYIAHHVDIIQNTAYHNGTEVGYADIFSNQCKDVNIMNNIMYARADNACNEKPRDVTEVYDYNIYFGGKVNYKGSNDIEADPMFVNLSLDRVAADFHLQPGSPGIHSGSAGKNRGACE